MSHTISKLIYCKWTLNPLHLISMCYADHFPIGLFWILSDAMSASTHPGSILIHNFSVVFGMVSGHWHIISRSLLGLWSTFLYARLVFNPAIMTHVNPTLENVFGTIGAVLWTIQILPQIWKSYRSKNTEGLSGFLMLWVRRIGESGWFLRCCDIESSSGDIDYVSGLGSGQ